MGAPVQETIGPLLAPAALAARVDDIKSGKIAVLYVGPDALFGRGHVPGARKVGAVESDEGRRVLCSTSAAPATGRSAPKVISRWAAATR